MEAEAIKAKFRRVRSYRSEAEGIADDCRVRRRAGNGADNVVRRPAIVRNVRNVDVLINIKGYAGLTDLLVVADCELSFLAKSWGR